LHSITSCFATTPDTAHMPQVAYQHITTLNEAAYALPRPCIAFHH
jgi:hypothetical protein